MEDQKQERLLLIGMVVSMFIWGLSWPSGKILATYGGAINIALCRFVFTFIGLLPIVLLAKERILIKKEGLITLGMAGLCLSLYAYLFFQGLKNGMPGAGGVLVTTLNPIIAYGIGLGLTRKLPSRKESIGLSLGLLAGCILLKVWHSTVAMLEPGNLYFLMASFTWAILSKFTAKAGRYGSSMSFSLWMYFICSGFMFIIAEKESLALTLVQTDSKFWWNMFFSAVITTSLATTFYFFATSKIGAAKASSFIFMVPASAALSSWLFLGEQIHWNTIVGGSLGAIAVYIMNKKEPKN